MDITEFIRFVSVMHALSIILYVFIAIETIHCLEFARKIMCGISLAIHIVLGLAVALCVAIQAGTVAVAIWFLICFSLLFMLLSIKRLTDVVSDSGI